MATTIDWLAEEPRLLVKQKREWGEILTGWETRNRYEVCTQEGETVLLAGETPGSFVWVILRQYVASRRPFTIELRDHEGKLWLTVQRPWRWWLDRAEILDGEGQHIGSLQQRFAIFTRHFEILDRSGAVVAEIVGPFWRPFTFEIKTNGQACGAIRKKWGGLAKELFTDADTFGVEYDGGMAPALRALCLGATFLLDFAYFESAKG